MRTTKFLSTALWILALGVTCPAQFALRHRVTITDPTATAAAYLAVAQDELSGHVYFNHTSSNQSSTIREADLAGNLLGIHTYTIPGPLNCYIRAMAFDSQRDVFWILTDGPLLGQMDRMGTVAGHSFPQITAGIIGFSYDPIADVLLYLLDNITNSRNELRELDKATGRDRGLRMILPQQRFALTFMPANGHHLVTKYLFVEEYSSTGQIVATHSSRLICPGLSCADIWDMSYSPVWNTLCVATDLGIHVFDVVPCRGSLIESGRSCSVIPAPVVRLSSPSCPEWGASLEIDYDIVPGRGQPVLLSFGLSNQSWSGIPLPLDLAVLGTGAMFRNCSLYTSQEILIGPFPKPGDHLRVSLPIPLRLPGIPSADLYCQAWQVFSQPRAGITATNYLAILIR